MARLLINIDHVATLRNARREAFPDPVHAATVCEAAGAHGIVFHLREDRRHITDRDVRLLKETVKGKLDFELSLAPEIVDICCATRPHLATLVPERREEVTTEGGLDVVKNDARLRNVVPRLFDAGVQEVALFVDADRAQIDAAKAVGANAIELHTGDFANAETAAAQQREAETLADGARHAHDLGLTVHAGHGLDYFNYDRFARTVPHVEEVSIGFAVVARAVLVGMEQAVRDMRAAIERSARAGR
jgi:pyridoxine 5-phosphate synthase